MEAPALAISIISIAVAEVEISMKVRQKEVNRIVKDTNKESTQNRLLMGVLEGSLTPWFSRPKGRLEPLVIRRYAED